MQAQHTGKPGLPQVQYVFLELPKYDAGEAPKSLVDKWAYFFREEKNVNVVPPALSQGRFRDALEGARQEGKAAGSMKPVIPFLEARGLSVNAAQRAKFLHALTSRASHR